MKKKYTKPTILVENSEGFLLLTNSKGVTGVMMIDNLDEIVIDYGGVDEDGTLDPSANGYGAWDDGSWDKL